MQIIARGGKDWLEKLREALMKQFTLPNLRYTILDRVYIHYESNLWDSKNEENVKKNHTYDSLRESDELNIKSIHQRRIVESDNERPTEDELSLSIFS